MEKWFIKNRPGDIEYISKRYNIPKFTATLLNNRDFSDERTIETYLNPILENLYEPKNLKDIDKAVDIILKDIKNKNKIRIIGDYDVDGVMASYILYKGISNLGGIVDNDIPNREIDGYGINKKMIDRAINYGIKTIITCDNGIAAIEEAEYAKSKGLNYIITDHHQLIFEEINGEKKYIYPNSDAIVNPVRPDCDYPFKKLCGAAVAYKLIEHLYNRAEAHNNNILDLLEYNAIATICDIVDLIDENRIIVKEGLERLNNTKNTGLLALLEVTDLKDKTIRVYDVGFIIGPSINASGRLENAQMAFDLLKEEDEKKALELAKKLKALNDERKAMTESGVKRAIEIVENKEMYKDSVIVIYEATIHESIAGIVAGRIKDRFNRPTIVLTDSLDGKLKGSARSISEFNIFEELNIREEFLLSYGGHKMAAGLKLDYSNLDNFRRSLNENDLTEDDLKIKRYIELELKLKFITERLINQIERLEPFGVGNPRPVFAVSNVNILSARILGKHQNVLKLILQTEDNRTIEGMLFRDIDRFQELIESEYGYLEFEKLLNGQENNIRLDLVYYPNTNIFNNIMTLQCIIESYRISR